MKTSAGTILKNHDVPASPRGLPSATLGNQHLNFKHEFSFSWAGTGAKIEHFSDRN